MGERKKPMPMCAGFLANSRPVVCNGNGHMTNVKSCKVSGFDIALLALALIFPSANAANQETIWDRQIPKQPFETGEFHQVRVPDWVEETVGVGYTLSGQNSEQRARAAAAGVTISELGFVDPFYPY